MCEIQRSLSATYRRYCLHVARSSRHSRGEARRGRNVAQVLRIRSRTKQQRIYLHLISTSIITGLYLCQLHASHKNRAISHLSRLKLPSTRESENAFRSDLYFVLYLHRCIARRKRVWETVNINVVTMYYATNVAFT